MNTFQFLISKPGYIYLFLLFSLSLHSQNAINIGKASYAEYPPQGAENQKSYRYSYKELKDKYPFYLHEKAQDQAVPTNDWWTDAIFSQYAGEMWAYPHAVSADSNGINIIYPDGFNKGQLSRNNFLEVKAKTNDKGLNFKPHSAKPFNWGDLSMQFRCEDENNNYMDATISHGSPFVWIELSGIKPLLSPSSKAILYTIDGKIIESFPTKGAAFSIQIGDRFYGIHVPDETTIEKKGENYFLDIPEEKAYLVISILPANSYLNTYASYALNKLVNTRFDYTYTIEKGEISTSFTATTENLNTKAKGGATIMVFQPHHYRTTKNNVKFIEGADYSIHLGKMQSAIGNKFTFNYTFTGLPPHLGKPQHMTAKQEERLNQMLNKFKLSRYGIDTYNKNLDELSELMLIARQVNHPNYGLIKETLKERLINWLSYDESEAMGKGFFFARYPQYGALIGFTAGFDSQVFNDQHFHYGYYVIAAARLMMVDETFKTGYADIIKLIAKNYANWERWDGSSEEQKLPFLRTFDPYAGHSWASGISYATGPDQESTSEAVMSWFGIFNLGLALNDKEIIALGAMGYKLETEATLEYYFNYYGDNFPVSYKHKYVGILHAGSIMHDTWFSKDPGWVYGIQSVPSAHYCSYLSKNDSLSEIIFKSAIQERVNQGFITTTNLYKNILDMNPQLGYYTLGNYANFKPKEALAIQDKLFEQENEQWKWNSQAAINYHLTSATITYGKPQSGYHTNLPAGAVYKNIANEITYLLYNHTNQDKDVKIYKDGNLIDTVPVKAGEFYSNKMKEKL